MKKTMTLNLPTQEMELLDALAAKMGMSKTAVMRKALRILNMVEGRLSKGERIFFEDDQQRAQMRLMFTSGL